MARVMARVMATKTATMMANNQQIVQRPLCSEEDFWRVHHLLRATYPITPLGFNWNIRRWEGRRFYDTDPIWPSPRLDKRAQLWETTGGELVGAVIPEDDGDAHLQLHPDYRALESAMISWAEEQLARVGSDGRRQLVIFANDYDLVRQELLADHGFCRTDDRGVARRIQLIDYPVGVPAHVEGYTLRPTNPARIDDCQRIADLLNAAFRRDFHNAQEYHNFTQLAPSFRRNLDLIAKAPDGTFAAYVGIPYDELNRLGIFEPVCTHPDHRRHGLAQMLMREGLRRLHTLGAREAIVETGNMIPANRLYESIGFTERCHGYFWHKATTD